MSLQNIKVINIAGGIQAFNTDTGSDIYIAPGDLLHVLVSSGDLGPVDPYVPPPSPEALPKYATLTEAIAAMLAFVEEFTAPLIGGFPEEERLSWPVKEAAARDYVALGTSAAPENIDMIETEAALLPETPLEVAQNILVEAAIFRKAAAAISGLRRKTQRELVAITDPHLYEPTLVAAAEDAFALALNLGLGAAFGLEQPS